MSKQITATLTEQEVVTLISVLTPIAMGFEMGFGFDNEQARALTESVLRKLLGVTVKD